MEESGHIKHKIEEQEDALRFYEMFINIANGYKQKSDKLKEEIENARPNTS